MNFAGEKCDRCAVGYQGTKCDLCAKGYKKNSRDQCEQNDPHGGGGGDVGGACGIARCGSCAKAGGTSGVAVDTCWSCLWPNTLENNKW